MSQLFTSGDRSIGASASAERFTGELIEKTLWRLGKETVICMTCHLVQWTEHFSCKDMSFSNNSKRTQIQSQA